MGIRIDLNQLPHQTTFKKGDFGKVSSLYTQMMSKGIVRDCAPTTDKNFLCFQIFKNSSDRFPLYSFSITRDENMNRFIYEITTANGKQIAQGNDIDRIIEKFKWYMGKHHNINEWKKPRRRSDVIS